MIRVLFVISCILLAIQPASMAAANYNDSLKAGDEAMGTGNADLAIKEFEAALGHAVAEGKKRLPKPKKPTCSPSTKRITPGPGKKWRRR